MYFYNYEHSKFLNGKYKELEYNGKDTFMIPYLPFSIVRLHWKTILLCAVFLIRIRIIGQDPDPDLYQETLIWIRVPKKNPDKLAYKSTKILKI